MAEINLQAPLQTLQLHLQLSMDIVGHALQAVDAFVPERDHTLPEGVLLAFGVSTKSHVPGTPIALQIARSIPMERRPQGARTWILRKGFGDVVTALGQFVLQQRSACLIVDVLRAGAPTHAAIDAAASVTSAEAARFDGKSLPEKIETLRGMVGADGNAEILDLEQCVLSINRARNCLEHRGGRVGPKDVPRESSEGLCVKWVGPDLTGDGRPGTVTTEEHIDKLRINLLTRRERTFPLGGALIFHAREYTEVCWTINEYAKRIDVALGTAVRADPVLKDLVR